MRAPTRSGVEEVTKESKKRGINAALLAPLLGATSWAAIGECASSARCGRRELAVVEVRVGDVLFYRQLPSVNSRSRGFDLHRIKVRWSCLRPACSISHLCGWIGTYSGYFPLPACKCNVVKLAPKP